MIPSSSCGAITAPHEDAHEKSAPCFGFTFIGLMERMNVPVYKRIVRPRFGGDIAFLALYQS